jgi:bifunctional DNA-binding transcriptional regulator/antitoxin component of YhaV-PrlF toxin-antitoxin module
MKKMISDGHKVTRRVARRLASSTQTVTQIKKRSQIVLPPSIFRAARLQDGDFVAMRVVGGSIVLTPQKLIDKSQMYFWTDTWQKAEREASDDIATGRTARFDSVDDLIKDLES